ncbi:MAG: PD40 domain-containing protein [Acidobacteria bacterium]|nr:PD40 domain-containing protein [Acidobacteriota bacterium]MBI3421712.1 PD40 domain-containing protein [Acidobacteriota bacterium]
MKRFWLVLFLLFCFLTFGYIGKHQTSTAQTTTPTDEVALIQLTTPTNAVGVNVRSVSNDGKRFVFDSINDYDGSNIDSNREIFVFDVDTRTVVQLTNTKDILDSEDATRTLIHITNNTPIISGDGTKIVFTSNAALTNVGNDDGNQEVYLIDFPRNATKRSDAKFTRLTDTNINITNEAVNEIFTNYSPTINDDGSVIAFVSTRRTFRALENGTPAFTAAKEGANSDIDPDGSGEIFLYNAATRRYAQVTATRDSETIVNFVVKGFNNFPKLSGDGKKLVFLSGFNFAGTTANKNTDFNGEFFLYNVGAAANTVAQLTDTTGTAIVPQLLSNGIFVVNTAAPMNLLPAFSRPLNRDGSLFVFESAGNFDSSNADKTRELWLLDTVANKFTHLTSQTVSATPTQDELKKLDYNFQPSLNTTGTFITFGSTLNLTPAATSSITADNADASREIFRYDIAKAAFRQITFTDGSTLTFDQRSVVVPSYPDTAGTAITFSYESNLIATNLTLNPEAFRAILYPVTGVNATAPMLTNAASFDSTQVARGSLVAAFGSQLSANVVSATTSPLPLELNNVRVTVRGIAAEILFVSPTQVNFIVPAQVGTSDTAPFTINNNGLQASGTVKLVDVAPGVFTVTGTGTGAATVQCGRVSDDGLSFVTSSPACEAGGDADTAYLVIYGTGWRNGSGLTVTFGDTTLTPVFSGAQGSLAGLDQINVPLVNTLAGMTDSAFTVNFGDVKSNSVTTSFSDKQYASFTLANAASYEGGTAARGSLALAQGEGLANDTADGAAAGFPFELKGVKVTVAGQPARLSYISPTQINFVVPDKVTPAEQVLVAINNSGTLLRARLIVLDAAPGVFTTAGTGEGTAVVKCGMRNADGTLTLSDPPCAVGTEAAPNVIRVYGTGWRFSPLVGLTIGGVDFETMLVYAGPDLTDTGRINGIDIIEARLPQSLIGMADQDVIVKTKVNGAERVSKAGIKTSFQAASAAALLKR